MVLMSFLGVGWKSGLYIYMIRQYFKGVPVALEEAAYIDGARTFKTFIKIMVPAAIPMMFTVFLFSFCWQWTDTFYVKIFLLSKKVLTTSITAFTSNNTANPVEMYNMLQTSTLIIISPLILLFILTQKFFVEGIERTGLVG
jgi:multiple sugar transport system permease protein